MPPRELGGSTGAIGGADVAVVVGAGAETASGGNACAGDGGDAPAAALGATERSRIVTLLLLVDQIAELAAHLQEVRALGRLGRCDQIAVRAHMLGRLLSRLPRLVQPALRRGHVVLCPLQRVDREAIGAKGRVDVVTSQLEVGTIAADDLLDERHLATMQIRFDRTAGEMLPRGDEQRVCGLDPRLRGSDERVGVLHVEAGEAELAVGGGDPLRLRVDRRLEARRLGALVLDRHGPRRDREDDCDHEGDREDHGEPPVRPDACADSHEMGWCSTARPGACVSRGSAARPTTNLTSRVDPSKQPSDETSRWTEMSREGVDQTIRSFPPSIGTCAPVVFANVGEQRATIAAATSLLVISTPSRLFVRYSSTERP